MFKISGDFVTQKARNLVLSGEWRKGLDFLKSTFEDIDYDSMLEVLQGNKKFVGENNLDLVEEDPNIKESYVEEVKDIYLAGRVIIDNRRYVVYGYVRAASEEDASIINQKISSGESRKQGKNGFSEWWMQLGKLYMNSPKHDKAFILQLPQTGKTVCALFEPDIENVDPPLWLSISKDPVEAIKLYGSILNVGYQSSKPDKEVLAIDHNTHPFYNPTTVNEISTVNENKANNISMSKNPLHPDMFDELKQNTLEANILEQFKIDVNTYEKTLREKILSEINSQGGTWDDFAYTEEHTGLRKKIHYPVEVMLAYSLSKTNAQHLMPKWTPVSPTGIKMDDDNPFHTDAWLACGFPLNWTSYAHKHPDYIAFHNLASELQKKLLGYEVQVLTAGKQESVYGTFRTPETFHQRDEDEQTILVVPHAGPEFETLFLKSRALICQIGGRLAHLVIVGRETNIPIVRDDNALEKYTSGLTGVIDLINGKVEIMPQLLMTTAFSNKKTAKIK